jgi:hypothetical protein
MLKPLAGSLITAYVLPSKKPSSCVKCQLSVDSL